MKKILALSVVGAMLLSQVAFATEALPEETEQAVISQEEAVVEDVAAETGVISVTLSLVPKMKVIDSVAVIELYDKDGNKLGSKEEWVGGVTETLELKFDVPAPKAGDIYKLKLADGLEYIKYYDTVIPKGGNVELQVYGYLNENGEPAVADSFALEASPLYEQAIVVYANGKILNLWPEAMLINDIAMVPVKAVANELGIKVRYDEAYNSIVCEVGKKQAIFNVGTAYATIMGTDMYMPANCEITDDTAYVPVRTLADAFGCSIEAIDFGDHIDVVIGESSIVNEYYNSIPVNKWGISSRTNYMVWIDKSDYMVRVYKGSKGRWEEIKSFMCAIGAPGSPTITGSYEYQYRMAQWSYPGYYVGPCLVFHGNYAIHSTLLQYNGAPYDNRVGVMISHGCVRVRKDDINWLDRNLPLKSRIYITQ